MVDVMLTGDQTSTMSRVNLNQLTDKVNTTNPLHGTSLVSHDLRNDSDIMEKRYLSMVKKDDSGLDIVEEIESQGSHTQLQRFSYQPQNEKIVRK